jgi:hypothetical protein
MCVDAPEAVPGEDVVYPGEALLAPVLDGLRSR